MWPRHFIHHTSVRLTSCLESRSQHDERSTAIQVYSIRTRPRHFLMMLAPAGYGFRQARWRDTLINAADAAACEAVLLKSSMVGIIRGVG